MGVSRKHHDHEPRRNTVDSDAATMHDLIRQVEATRSLGQGEQGRLVQRAGLGDKASQERRRAVKLGLVIRLAASRAEQGLSMPDLGQEGSIGLGEAARSYAARGES